MNKSIQFLQKNNISYDHCLYCDETKLTNSFLEKIDPVEKKRYDERVCECGVCLKKFKYKELGLYLAVNGYYYENIFTEKTKKIIKEILKDELIYQKKEYPWTYENTLITYSNEYPSDHWSLKLTDLAEELNKICFPCPSIVRPGYSLWSYSIFLRRLGASENIFLRKQDFFKNDFLMSCSSY